jgi:glutamyl-tRNA reductase
VALAEDEIPALYEQLRRLGARESLILSTCNRTEVYAAGPEQEFNPDKLFAWLAGYRGISLDRAHFFTLTSLPAARHLMEVAAGIDSQVIGDIQIIGQVKSAYQSAKSAGGLGPVLTRMCETALRAGKRVKTETDLFAGAASVSYVAVELARKIFYPLESQRTLVIGAGETGELTASSLMGRGVDSIFVANRTPGRAAELIGRIGAGSEVEWNDLAERLHEFDIVVVATGAREYVLDYETVRRASERRSGKPMLIVDLAVPRNVDPQVSEVPGVFCKDLNDLNSVIEGNVEKRRASLPDAERIISEELDEFARWHRLTPVRPVIAELRKQVTSIAEEVLAENRNRFDDKAYENVEKLVHSVVKRIIGTPLSHLLSVQDSPEEAETRATRVRELFGLRRNDGESGASDDDS